MKNSPDYSLDRGKDSIVRPGFTAYPAGIGRLRRLFPDLRIYTVNFPEALSDTHRRPYAEMRPGVVLINPNRAVHSKSHKIY